MRILVTGATGRVGRRFVPRLLRWNAPHEVRVLVRDRRAAEPLAALGATVVVGELPGTPEAVSAAVAGVDAVVNLAAAFRGVPDDEAWSVNHAGALALARAARAAGARRFVQVGTNLVYGAGRGRPHRESDEPVPTDGPLWGAYPESKIRAERELLVPDADGTEGSTGGGMDVRIARLAFVYGDGDDHLALALPWITGWAAHKRTQLVHHADVARGLWRLLRAPGDAHSRAFHLADDTPMSAVELLEVLGEPAPEGMAERADDDPWHGIVSTRLIREELGWRPRYPSLWSALDAGAL
jgi:nucleoside-diphosphate-sugar epimerase